MIKLRKSQERGHANHGWLDSYHSFSFAEYFDAEHMQYSALRVINEDVVAGGEGFGMHPHRDMEIVTYILSGSLRHQDSMGNGSIIGVGDVQRMTAGTGVRHSEFNASQDVPVHLLQIWITPSENNLTPSYEEKHFSRQEKENQWRLIASRNGHDGSITIHQDVNLYATILTPQKQEKLPIAPNRCAYVQVVSGEILLEDKQLIAGDAAKVSEEQLLNIQALQESELLWFDLPIQSMQ